MATNHTGRCYGWKQTGTEPATLADGRTVTVKTYAVMVPNSTGAAEGDQVLVGTVPKMNRAVQYTVQALVEPVGTATVRDMTGAMVTVTYWKSVQVNDLALTAQMQAAYAKSGQQG